MKSKFTSKSGNPAKKLSDLAFSVVEGADKGLRAVCLTLVAAHKGLLSTPGQGKEYRRGKKKKHRASKPGDPPARDTSDLHNSIDFEQTGPLHYREGTGLEYAAPLEFGTETIAPRPFMRPGKEAAEKQMGTAIKAELKQSLKGLSV